MVDAAFDVAVSAEESTKQSLKRKREKSHCETLTVEERERWLDALNEELRSLCRYFRETMSDSVVTESHLACCSARNLNGMIAVLLEEKSTSYSKLVNEVYEKVRERDGGVAVASVKSGVLHVGQRVSYGVPNAEGDVLEDETEYCLWCWETREMKYLPSSIRETLKIRRTCRRKINERIVAIIAVMSALQRYENHQALVKATYKLNKVLNEAEIRLLVKSMAQKTASNLAVTETKKKDVIKQLEKNKREVDKERKRMDRALQKQRLQNEKELKWLQEEAEKNEKLREKEESEIRKQMKRKQEEAERDQRRREKEEAEAKKKRAIQKQASLMERFVKKSYKISPPDSDSDQSPGGAKCADLSKDSGDTRPDSVTFLMDSALSQNDEIGLDDIRMAHLSAWHCLGLSVRSRSKQHWGIRCKPKVELMKELKLTTDKGQTSDEDLIMQCMVDEWGEAKLSDDSCNGNIDGSSSNYQKRRRSKQLLQFDKSCRPAFYGVWPKESVVVRPRHPLKKDPDLDYDVDSEEEWDEEDPGESLSDCDKDEDEGLEGPCLKADEESESDDGFFVPDGYLSENEGVENDRTESSQGDVHGRSTHEPESDFSDYSVWIRQQRTLQNLTDHALRKNQPLIIINLMHEKSSSLPTEDLGGTHKIEQICLQALAIRAFPDSSSAEVPCSTCLKEEHEDAQVRRSEGNGSIRSTASTPNAVLSKNGKKENAEKSGLSISPERSGGRAKTIASFFSKRCMPPGNHSAKPHEEVSPESSQKSRLSGWQLPESCTYDSK